MRAKDSPAASHHDRAPSARSSSTTREDLSVREAWEVSAALASHMAEKANLPALVIKGASLESHGLRGPYSSSDLDLLCRPSDVQTLTESLLAAGWQLRPAWSVGDLAPRHSVALIHQGWPIDVDLHSQFPGLLTGPTAAFEALWASRVRIVAAGGPIWVPDRSSSIVIWALHSLRGASTQLRHATELFELTSTVLPRLSEAERSRLANRIVELGADEPLSVVPEFAELIGGRRGRQMPSARAAWTAELAQTHEISPWIQVLRGSPMSAWPKLLVRAAWPSAHDLRLMDEALVDTPLGRVQSRGRRAWRLVRRIVERRRQAH